MNSQTKPLPACRRLLFPRATKEIGDVCTQANKTLDLKCVTLSIISTWGSCVEMKRIHHLRISHNTPCLPPSSPAPPPKQKYCVTSGFFFYLFWVLQLSQEKLKTMHVQNFGGKQDALYLRRCANWRSPTLPQGLLVFKYGGDRQD